MKKFLALAAICFVVSAAQAQVSLVSQYANTIDTVTNTATKYLTIATPYGSFYKVTDLEITYTKISGTQAGTVTVQYSLNGTDYYSVQQDSVLTVTDATTLTLGWQLKDKALKYIRIKATGAGTMSSQIKAVILPRKENI